VKESLSGAVNISMSSVGHKETKVIPLNGEVRTPGGQVLPAISKKYVNGMKIVAESQVPFSMCVINSSQFIEIDSAEIMSCSVSRVGTGWKFVTIGHGDDGKTYCTFACYFLNLF
jgi:hypothetical protein